MKIAHVIQPTEKIVIEQLQQGNKLAFEAAVNQYKNMVFRTCMGFLHNVHDAEDITQEVFIQMYRSLDDFRGDAKLSTWLYRIAVNKSLNLLRSRQSKSWLKSLGELFGGESDSMFQLADQHATSDKELENTETGAAIRQAIDSLPEKQRIAFTLSNYEDLSYAQISEVMEVSLSSIESLLHRAKKNLQAKLIHVYKNM